MRQIKLQKGNFTMTDEIEGFLERTVTKFGTSAKIDCPKKFLGKRVYVLVCKDQQHKEVI
jgi:putative transposon-encoded protein